MWELIFVTVCVVYVDAHWIDKMGKESSNRMSRDVTPAPSFDVTTTNGPVRGVEESGVVQFFDIPYGAFSEESPMQDPGEPSKWTDIRYIKEHTSLCPQMKNGIYVGDNDCLTLSVFKSTTPVNGASASADVLFHIHDTSFSSGSGDPLVYGPKYLVGEGVILVLPNYRLGALGFLCAPNNTAPGNAALKDLTLALKWTSENIMAFGGNPSNIVVSGEGAGAALVEYLLISNKSRNFISRAITESGSSLSPWAIDRNPLSTASSLNEILQGKINMKLLVESAVDIDLRPCVEQEGGFITESPWQLLQSNATEIAYMAGAANHAAWKKAVQQTETEQNLYQLNSNLSLLLPNDLRFENDAEKLRIGRQLRSLYFGERNISMTDVNQLSQLFTDSGYLNPGIRAARLLVKGGANVYFYEFSFNNPTLQQAFNASIRGDSLDFVFSRSEQIAERDLEQVNMRNIMTSLWVSFIKTGKPSANSIEWNAMKSVSASDEEWLSIGSQVRMQMGLHLSRLTVWQEIYDKHFIDNNLGLQLRPVLNVYVLASGLSILVRIYANRLLSP